MSDQRPMAVRRVGEGLPVLFIHGWTMAGSVEANDFEPIFTKKSGYHRMYVDLPGIGESPIGSATDLDSMVDSVSEVIDTVILPSKFLLVGTSCGAYLARAVAYRYADAVEGLLLRVPVVEPETSKRDVDPFVPLIRDEAMMSSLSHVEREGLGDIPIQTSEHLGAVRRRARATWIPASAACDSAALDPIRDDAGRYRITAPFHGPKDPFCKPSLILTGRQDTDVGYRDAWPLTACYPRATFVALDRGDHGLPVDQLGLFEALVCDWSWRVEKMRKAVG